MLKVMVVFGTRPEAIKMCPVVIELKKHENLEVFVCLTGQHREMLLPVMKTFGVKEDCNLDIMKEKQTLAEITESVLKGLDKIYVENKPDLVLVHGDTTTSYVAALCAFYHKIPVGHVEAGLRTYDMLSPFPEEFNRQSVDLIADLLFAPTNLSKENLIKDGRDENKIVVTGNTVIDALNTTVTKEYRNEYLDWAKDSKLILMTIHRRESLGKPMAEIFKAIKQIVKENKEVKVIYPMHKNPAVREIANNYLGDCERIKLIEPLDVVDFHNFISKSYLVVTDSGGIQEEAPSLGVPVLVARDVTERPEGIQAGTLRLIGTKYDSVYTNLKELLTNQSLYESMSHATNPYGDGHASEKIVDSILRRYI